MRTNLSNSQRSILRAYIVRHPGWKDYAANKGINSGQLTSTACMDYCDTYGIDYLAVLRNHAPSPAGPSPFQKRPVMREKVALGPVGSDDKPKAHPVAPVGDTDDDEAALLEAIRALKGRGGAVDPEQVKAIVAEMLSPLEKAIAQVKSPLPVVKMIDAERADIGELPSVRHKDAEKVAMLCAARGADGLRKNVWIAGPMGSGKTTMARQVASALGLDFGFHGSCMLPHELLGFVDAGGQYHQTQFVKLYRDGGLCLLDEIDGSSAQATLALNAALANGIMALPNGEIVARHPDFACIGAANTWGHGANSEYVGRNKLDGAFLDRFAFKVAIDYDLDLEESLAGGFVEWLEIVRLARDYTRSQGVKVAVSPRVVENGAALLAAYDLPLRDLANMTFLSGLPKNTADDIWTACQPLKTRRSA